jgi:hypothetical protein
MYPSIVARERLDKNVIAATNTHAIIEELLDASFSMWYVSYQRKAGDYFLPELLVCLFVFCVSYAQFSISVFLAGGVTLNPLNTPGTCGSCCAGPGRYMSVE